MHPPSISPTSQKAPLGAALITAAIALASLPGVALARTEYRGPAWKWCIYDCSYWGDYDSADEAVSAFNAKIDADYLVCMASTAASECGSGCYKLNRYSPRPVPGFARINGISTYHMTALNQSTSFSPACGERAAETTITTIAGGSIAAIGTPACPKESLWGSSTSNFHYEDIEGVATPAYDWVCPREIPDPQTCGPKFGNPVSPTQQSKTQVDTDYDPPNAQLAIVRSYVSSEGGGWSLVPLGGSLTDFTGRFVTNTGGYTGTVDRVPGGYYPSGRPPPTPTPASFPLIKTQPDSGLNEVWMIDRFGGRKAFSETAPGVFVSSSGAKPDLRISGTGLSTRWTYIDKRSGYDVFDQTGLILSHTDLTGRGVTYSRSPGSVSLTDNATGRAITLTFDLTSNALKSATMADGNQITYSADSLGNVFAVTYADGSKLRYVYNEPSLTGGVPATGPLLTGIVDENSVRVSTFEYDAMHLPVRTERAGGVGSFSFQYTGFVTAGSVRLTDPLGTISTLNWGTGPDGERRLESQTQAAGSGCSASASNVAYDSGGNVSVRDDFNGTRACYASDLARNLQTARVDGLPGGSDCASLLSAGAAVPSGSRKVSTQWHPDWRLENGRAEPLKRTTWVYNGQPDPFNGNAPASCAPTTALLPDGKPIAVLCKQVEQATTDVDGHLGFAAVLQPGVPNRVQQWTYTQYGQVLTAKGPRTDVNETASYVYYATTTADYAKGDLKQITDPAGRVTQLPKYNRHGQVLRMIDPNGIVTDNTYDLRLRLTSATVGGLRTSYLYDSSGLLKRVTLPDTTTINYSYDAARRLSQVTDQAGNSVTYTLDSGGNRVKEDIKDASGTLARSVARAFDALSRLQQITGVAR